MTFFSFQFPFSGFIIALDKTAKHFKKPHSSNLRAWAESQSLSKATASSCWVVILPFSTFDEKITNVVTDVISDMELK